mgnify:CR=1 FL=1
MTPAQRSTHLRRVHRRHGPRRRRHMPQAALREGLRQIHARHYDAELLAAGASKVHAFAVAFDGKRVWVKAGGAMKKKAMKAGATPKKARATQ